MKHTESQRTRLKQHFDSGKSVTRLTAFIDLGICELSSRIGELEKSGYAVAREMIKVTNRFGEEVKVMKYRKDEVCPQCGGKGLCYRLFLGVRTGATYPCDCTK